MHAVYSQSSAVVIWSHPPALLPNLTWPPHGCCSPDVVRHTPHSIWCIAPRSTAAPPHKRQSPFCKDSSPHEQPHQACWLPTRVSSTDRRPKLLMYFSNVFCTLLFFYNCTASGQAHDLHQRSCLSRGISVAGMLQSQPQSSGCSAASPTGRHNVIPTCLSPPFPAHHHHSNLPGTL